MQATASNPTPRQLAAQKAWVTMRARKAAALATAVPLVTALSVAVAAELDRPAPQPTAIHNISTDADLVVKVYREPELVDVDELRYVTLFLMDDPIVGNGQRQFVVLSMSSTKVVLFYAPMLATTTVSRDHFDRHHLPVGRRRFNPSNLAALIRKRIALADRINGEAMDLKFNDGGREAQRALALIEA